MPRLLIIDTETGGLEPTDASILSLAAVVWEDGQVLDSVEFFIAEPEICCDAEAYEIHHIDAAWLTDHGLAPAEAVAQFEGYLETHFPSDSKIRLCGHNINFDVGFVKRLYRLAGAEYQSRFSHRLLDIASVVQFLMLTGHLPLTSGSSSKVFDHFGIHCTSGKRHSAIGDATATAQLLSELVSYAQANLQAVRALP